MVRPSKRHTRLLLVEGQEDKHVVWHLCRRHGIDNEALFDVHDAGGFERLREDLGQRPKFGLQSIWVIVDADDSSVDRWRSLRDVFVKLGYPEVPKSPSPNGTVLPAVGSLARIGIWLMPDNESPGILEDFLTRLVVEGDPLLPRAKAAVDAIPDQERRFAGVKQPKALLHTWLAWQEEPGAPLGQAITRHYLETNHELATRFIAWLRSMFESP
jgi:hypothetical protein